MHCIRLYFVITKSVNIVSAYMFECEYVHLNFLVKVYFNETNSRFYFILINTDVLFLQLKISSDKIEQK